MAICCRAVHDDPLVDMYLAGQFSTRSAGKRAIDEEAVEGAEAQEV